jgi:hypothetical protein
MAGKKSKSVKSTTASLGFEAKLITAKGECAGANPEDPDEFKAENVFWAPADARWSRLQAKSSWTRVKIKSRAGLAKGIKSSAVSPGLERRSS